MTTKALLLIDPQNDFTQGGSLAVNRSTQIYSYLNDLKESKQFSLVVISQDYHPNGHISFASTHKMEPFAKIQLKDKIQQLWPVHCIQGTKGAQFYPQLNINGTEKIVRKGTRKDKDSYSAFQFFDDSCQLQKLLKSQGITQVVVAGLAFDFCVGSTALDAKRLGFKSSIVKQATKSVSYQTQKIMQKRLAQAGIQLIQFADICPEHNTN